MLEGIALAAEALVGPHAAVLFEVQSAAGIPDVVVTVLDESVVAERALQGFLVEPPMLAAAVALSDALSVGVELTTAEIAAAASVTERHLVATVLPALAVRGLAAEVDRRSWVAIAPYRSVARTIVTLEAKLRDWRRGLSQAARHASSADEAWLVLDAAAATERAVVDAWRFEAVGVGLAALDQDNCLARLIPPTSCDRTIRLRRELLAERTAALHSSGEVSGPVARVFGRHLWAVTRPDPRLADAAGR